MISVKYTRSCRLYIILSLNYVLLLLLLLLIIIIIIIHLYIAITSPTCRFILALIVCAIIFVILYASIFLSIYLSQWKKKQHWTALNSLKYVWNIFFIWYWWLYICTLGTKRPAPLVRNNNYFGYKTTFIWVRNHQIRISQRCKQNRSTPTHPPSKIATVHALFRSVW